MVDRRRPLLLRKPGARFGLAETATFQYALLGSSKICRAHREIIMRFPETSGIKETGRAVTGGEIGHMVIHSFGRFPQTELNQPRLERDT